jgi:hypothetical protein
VPTVAFDRNRSVGRILRVSLVADGSRNGRNPDLSIVMLKGLLLRRFQSSLLLLAALLCLATAAVTSLITQTSFLFSRTTMYRWRLSMLEMSNERCMRVTFVE